MLIGRTDNIQNYLDITNVGILLTYIHLSQNLTIKSAFMSYLPDTGSLISSSFKRHVIEFQCSHSHLPLQYQQ